MTAGMKDGPRVDRKQLILLAGAVWLAVGTGLCAAAVRWLARAGASAGFALAGCALACAIYFFGFTRLVDKNMERIAKKDERTCVFGFQSWRSYLLVMIMISMGAGLRACTLPKPYLAVLYLGIGGAMLLSSVKYLRLYLRG